MNPLKWLYKKTIDHTRFREIAQRFAVFIIPFFYLGHRPHQIGLIIAALGVLIRAWAAGYLKKDQELACEGPYMIARHPLYLGSCILSLGMILTIQHWFVTIFFGGLTVLIYQHTIRHEEKNLVKHFGDKYRELQKNTGPLWPKPAGLLLALKSPNKLFQGFSFNQYLKNKEYECLAGVIAIFLILYFFPV